MKNNKNKKIKYKIFLGGFSLVGLTSIIVANLFFFGKSNESIENTSNTNVVYSEITGKPVSGLTYDPANQLVVKDYDILQSFFKTSITSNSELIDYSTNLPIGASTSSNIWVGQFDLKYFFEGEAGNIFNPEFRVFDNIERSATGDWITYKENRGFICDGAFFGFPINSYINQSKSVNEGSNYVVSQDCQPTDNPVSNVGPANWNLYGIHLLNLEEKSAGYGNAWTTSGTSAPYSFAIGRRGDENLNRVKVSRSVFDYWKFRQNDWKNPGEQALVKYLNSNNKLSIGIPELSDPGGFGFDRSNFNSSGTGNITVPGVNVKVYDADVEERLGKEEALISDFNGDVNYRSGGIPDFLPSVVPGWYTSELTIQQIYDHGTGGNNVYAEIIMPLTTGTAAKFQTTQMPYWYNKWVTPIQRITVPSYSSLPGRDIYYPKVSRGENSVKIEWNSELIDWNNIKNKTADFVIYRENENGTEGPEISRTIIDNSSGSLNSSSISVGGIYPNESYIFKFEYVNKRPSSTAEYSIEYELDSTFYSTEVVYSSNAWRSKTINTESEFNLAFTQFSSSINFSENFLIYDTQAEKYLSSSDRYTYTGTNPGYGGSWGAGYFPWVDTPRAGYGFKVGTVNTTDIGIKWSQGGTFNSSWSSTEWLSALSNTSDGGGGAIIGYTQNDVIGEKRSSWQIETNSLGEVAFKSKSTSTGGRSGGYLLPAASSYNPSTSGVTNGVDANFAQANATLQSTPYYFQLHRIIAGDKKTGDIKSPVARNLSSKIDNQNLEIRLDSNFNFATTLNSNQIRFRILNQNGNATSISGNITSANRTLNLNLTTLTRKQKYKLEVSYDLAQDAGKDLKSSTQVSTWNEEFEFTYDWFDSSQFSELEITKINQQSNLATIGFKVLDQSIDGEYIRNNFNYFVAYDYYGQKRKSSNFSYDQRTQYLSTEVEIDWNFNYSFELNIESLALSSRFSSLIVVDNGNDLSSNPTSFNFSSYKTHISFIGSVDYNEQDFTNNTINVNLDLANSLRPDSIRNNNVVVSVVNTSLGTVAGYSNLSWAQGASSATASFDYITKGRYEIEIEYQFSYTIGGRVLYQVSIQSIIINV